MKFFIINIAIRNFLNVLIFLLWQPATLFPMVCAFSFGILGTFGPEGNYLGFEITTVLVLNQIVSYKFMLEYQYAVMKERGKLLKFLSDSESCPEMPFIVFLRI